MSGWKTKAGSMVLALGGFVMAMSKAFPDFDDLLNSGGQFLVATGTALTAWGLGHKIEKMGKSR